MHVLYVFLEKVLAGDGYTTGDPSTLQGLPYCLGSLAARTVCTDTCSKERNVPKFVFLGIARIPNMNTRM